MKVITFKTVDIYLDIHTGKFYCRLDNSIDCGLNKSDYSSPKLSNIKKVITRDLAGKEVKPTDPVPVYYIKDMRFLVEDKMTQVVGEFAILADNGRVSKHQVILASDLTDEQISLFVTNKEAYESNSKKCSELRAINHELYLSMRKQLDSFKRI